MCFYFLLFLRLSSSTLKYQDFYFFQSEINQTLSFSVLKKILLICSIDKNLENHGFQS